MNPIEFISVTKRFKASEKLLDEITILKDINFTLQEGCSTAIIGKSGSGKSTLLHLAGGLDKPSEGRVLLHGEDYAKLDDKKNSKLRNNLIGFIFQANLLLEDYSALENVMCAALIKGQKTKECIERAKYLLFKLGLEDRINHVPGKLSGGEKQRVAICRALMNDPKVILADEPTGALDEENALEVENLLLEIVKEEKKSLLLVTHNNEFAYRCDYVYNLKNHNLYLEKGL